MLCWVIQIYTLQALFDIVVGIFLLMLPVLLFQAMAPNFRSESNGSAF